MWVSTPVDLHRARWVSLDLMGPATTVPAHSLFNKSSSAYPPRRRRGPCRRSCSISSTDVARSCSFHFPIRRRVVDHELVPFQQLGGGEAGRDTWMAAAWSSIMMGHGVDGPVHRPLVQKSSRLGRVCVSRRAKDHIDQFADPFVLCWRKWAPPGCPAPLTALAMSMEPPLLRTSSIMFSASTMGMSSSISCKVR